MSAKLWFRFLLPIVLLTLLISSCDAAPSGGTYVWIDVPLDGLSFPDIQPVKIEGHATGAEGVSHVELYVDGDLWNTIEDPPSEGTLVSFQAEWTPLSAGRYTIHAIAYGNDGSSSQYDETRISFGEETPTPEITDTPVPEEPVEPPPPEEGSIQFWAEPETIQAGGCTTLYWQTENVQQVVFGGIEQPLEGSYQDCLCKNQTYTLTTILLDGTEEKRMVDITVTGSCETPSPTPTKEPEVDTTTPPAPAQAVPSNGLSIGCKSFQDLVWLPVSDKSGISEYQVQVQRHSGDNNWTDIPGSVFSGITAKQTNIGVDCGWYFRWRVRAKDGAGNMGPWSGWWQFVINLE